MNTLTCPACQTTLRLDVSQFATPESEVSEAPIVAASEPPAEGPPALVEGPAQPPLSEPTAPPRAASPSGGETGAQVRQRVLGELLTKWFEEGGAWKGFDSPVDIHARFVAWRDEHLGYHVEDGLTKNVLSKALVGIGGEYRKARSGRVYSSPAGFAPGGHEGGVPDDRFSEVPVGVAEVRETAEGLEVTGTFSPEVAETVRAAQVEGFSVDEEREPYDLPDPLPAGIALPDPVDWEKKREEAFRAAGAALACAPVGIVPDDADLAAIASFASELAERNGYSTRVDAELVEREAELAAALPTPAPLVDFAAGEELPAERAEAIVAAAPAVLTHWSVVLDDAAATEPFGKLEQRFRASLPAGCNLVGAVRILPPNADEDRTTWVLEGEVDGDPFAKLDEAEGAPAVSPEVAAVPEEAPSVSPELSTSGELLQVVKAGRMGRRAPGALPEWRALVVSREPVPADVGTRLFDGSLPKGARRLGLVQVDETSTGSNEWALVGSFTDRPLEPKTKPRHLEVVPEPVLEKAALAEEPELDVAAPALSGGEDSPAHAEWCPGDHAPGVTPCYRVRRASTPAPTAEEVASFEARAAGDPSIDEELHADAVADAQLEAEAAAGREAYLEEKTPAGAELLAARRAASGWTPPTLFDLPDDVADAGDWG